MNQRGLFRATWVILCFVALGGALIPAATHAKGIIWLRTKRASSAPVLLHPSLATYRNHAYILSVKETGDNTSVYFTTNESKRWKTSLVSAKGPHASYSQEFVGLAIDPSQNKLYATWIYQKDRDHMALGVWTRTGTGAWSGPTVVATSGALIGQPTVVAGGGHAYIAFLATPQSYAGSCDDRITHAEDVQVASSTGGGWSVPQNLTSCATGPEATEFNDPKLAMDETGKAYLVSRAGSAEGNLWYADTASGSWSQATRITSGLKIPEFALSPAQRTLYGIGASRGSVWIAYTTGQKRGAVLLMQRPAGGSFGRPVQASAADSAGCPQFGVAVAARAGRVLVSYIRAYGGNCAVIGTTNDYNTVHLMAGTGTRLHPVSPGLPRAASCGDTALSSDGDLFRLVAACGIGTAKENGNLYYKKEFWDVVGPKAHMLLRRLSPQSVRLTWTARDPTPGSGVAYAQVQARSGAGLWRTVTVAIRARTVVYPVQPGRSYTFRLRARDRVNNWGPWVTAGVRAS